MSDAPTGVPAHRSFRGYSCNGGRGVALEAGMSWYFRSAGWSDDLVQTATAADELCDGRNNSERIRQSDFRPERVDPALGFIGGQVGSILLRLVGLLGERFQLESLKRDVRVGGCCASIKAQEFLLPVYQSECSLSLPVIAWRTDPPGQIEGHLNLIKSVEEDG